VVVDVLYDIWERYRRWLSAAGILLFASLSFYLYDGGSDQHAPGLPLETPVYAAEHKGPEHNESGSRKTSEQTRKQEPVPLMYADIKGSVKQPGMYEISANERVAHLIAKAGGLLPEADRLRINLAQPLNDGVSVWIPSTADKGAHPSPCDPPLAQSTGQPAPGPAHSASGKVNINTASLQELQTLPGIGETRAQAIISFREKNGPFEQPEQLKKITGIGDKTYERLKDKISVK
jgi:competence protein ComEA